MQILSQLTTTTTIYELIVEDKKYYYKEYLNDKGKLLEWALFDDDNNELYDANLAEYIAEQIYM
jgi:hypothetical protein